MTLSADVKEALSTANRKFMESFKQGDAASLATLYTENGQLLPAASDFVTGRPAIQAFWQGAMDMGIKSARLETVEMESHGDTAHEVGKYSLHGEAGQLMDQGKYIVIWKQHQGQWKLHRDIWTTSMASAGQ
jgi:ketosteroid isomerase-like protein